MNLMQLPDFLYACYKARRVSFLWGPKGVGKSDGIAQAAKLISKKIKDKNFGYVDLRLGTQDVGDLIGIPRVRTIDGEEKTVWAAPAWWPKEGTNGLIVLDEFNRAGTNDVIQAMFQFVLGSKDKNGKIHRMLHTHVLPEGWSVSAIDLSKTSDVVQAIDTAMLDRFIQIRIDVDKKVSQKWMEKNLKEQDIWKFVQSNRDSLGKPEQYSINTTPSPRSYEIVDDMLKNMTEDDFNNFRLEVISGIIGDTLGMLLYKQLKDNLLKPLTAEEVLNCKDFEQFVKGKLTKYISKNKNHLELIDVTLTDLLSYIEKKKPTKKQAKNVTDFIECLPADMAVKFYQEGVVHEDNFLPIILDRLDEKRNGFTIELMQAMGYEKGVIEEGIKKLDEISEEYEKESGKKDK